MLVCFAGTLCYGMYNGNGWESIMLGAAGVAVIALIVGGIVGSLALRTVDEQIRLHKEANPIPDENETPGQEPGQAAA